MYDIMSSMQRVKRRRIAKMLSVMYEIAFVTIFFPWDNAFVNKGNLKAEMSLKCIGIFALRISEYSAFYCRDLDCRY